MLIKINPIQKELIARIALNANKPLHEIAKDMGIKERTLRYHLNYLRENNIIKKAPFLNIYPLGFQYVTVYFSIDAAKSTSVQKVIHILTQDKQVSWLAEVGGDFHFGASLRVRTVEEVKTIFDSWLDELHLPIFEKSLAFHLSLQVYPAKFLCGENFAFDEIGYGSNKTSFEYDELDSRILAYISKTFETSGRAVARALGQPHATVELRIKKMQQAGVISGSWYLCDVSKFGYQTLKLLVYARGNRQQLALKLKAYAKKHPSVSYYIESLGSWDFELGVDSSEPSQVSSITRDLYDQFGSMLQTVKVIPMFRVLKVRQFE